MPNLISWVTGALLFTFALFNPNLLLSNEIKKLTWQNPLPQGNSIAAMWEISESDLYAVGEVGTILHYNGMRWERVHSGTSLWLSSVWGDSKQDIFAAGDNGVILHFDGAQWISMESGVTNDLNSLFRLKPTSFIYF